MEKDFFDVFPHLKVKKELEELLDMVFVTKVSMNPRKNSFEGLYRKQPLDTQEEYFCAGG